MDPNLWEINHVLKHLQLKGNFDQFNSLKALRVGALKMKKNPTLAKLQD